MGAAVRWPVAWCIAAGFGLFLSFTARVAMAEDADALIKHGVELRKQGNDREALAEFERARALGETPRLTAQIGLAEFALGQWSSAEESLTKALESPSDPWIKLHRAALTDALKKVGAHLGSVEVWGEPAGAEVLVNGKRAGTLPSPPAVHVAAGTCSVLVRAEGYEDARRELSVPPRGRVREYFELVRLPPVAGTPSSSASRRPGGAAPGAQPSAAPTAAALAAPPPESPTNLVATPADTSSDAGGASASGSIFTRWWFWTAVGVVASGAVATYLLTAPKKLDCPAGWQCFGN